MGTRHILAIDQGTTSSRAMIFDAALHVVAVAQREFSQSFPQPGWVEHDPEEIWESVRATCADALAKAGLAAKDIAAIGITNQRETSVVWERASGRPSIPPLSGKTGAPHPPAPRSRRRAMSRA